MSYRHAWLLILNHCFRQPVVRARSGGSLGGGAEPTEFGCAITKSAASGAAKSRLRGLEAGLRTSRARIPGGSPNERPSGAWRTILRILRQFNWLGIRMLSGVPGVSRFAHGVDRRKISCAGDPRGSPQRCCHDLRAVCPRITTSSEAARAADIARAVELEPRGDHARSRKLSPANRQCVLLITAFRSIAHLNSPRVGF
jgi:hypothetical protein